VEGPYGKFTFQDRCPVQIWIAGGVGVTPFIARLHQRRMEPQADAHEVHFFFTSESDHEEGMGQLTALAAEAGVTFRFLHTPRDGFLTGEQVRDAVSGWRDASSGSVARRHSDGRYGATSQHTEWRRRGFTKSFSLGVRL
jgi:predicted ferric reductase